MKCNRCGTEVMDGRTTCPHCGNILQSRITMTHVGDSGQVVTGAITSNGASLNLSPSIKSPKVALVIAGVIAVLSLVVLGTGIFLLVKGENNEDTKVNEPDTSLPGVGGVGTSTVGGSVSENGNHIVSCVQEGKTSGLEISLGFVDGKLSVVEYNAVLDTSDPDEVAMSITFIMMEFEELKDMMGVDYGQITSGSQQTISYRFRLNQMSKTAIEKLGVDSSVTWSRAEEEIKTMEAEGFTCTKE